MKLFYCFQSDHTVYMIPSSAEAFHLPTSSSASDTHLSIFCTVPWWSSGQDAVFSSSRPGFTSGNMCFFWSSPGGTSDKKNKKKKQKKTCLQTQETSEMQVQSLGQEDPLEEEMATHSNILAWRMPWTEEPGGLQFMGLQRVRHD